MNSPNLESQVMILTSSPKLGLSISLCDYAIGGHYLHLYHLNTHDKNKLILDCKFCKSMISAFF